MKVGGPSVWTNFSYFNLNNTPSGWLLNQKGSLLILFSISWKSEKNSIYIYTHLFYAKELGEIGRLKNLRLQSLGCASETWNELIEGGWTVVTNKFQ